MYRQKLFILTLCVLFQCKLDFSWHKISRCCLKWMMCICFSFFLAESIIFNNAFIMFVINSRSNRGLCTCLHLVYENRRYPFFISCRCLLIIRDWLIWKIKNKVFDCIGICRLSVIVFIKYKLWMHISSICSSTFLSYLCGDICIIFAW